MHQPVVVPEDTVDWFSLSSLGELILWNKGKVGLTESSFEGPVNPKGHAGVKYTSPNHR